MSIAGRRAGLDGSRSNLFYEAIRIIKEMRDKTNGKYPRYAVWENVTGALSSNSGEDFKSVIENFCQIKDSKISVPRPAKWQNAGVVIGDGYLTMKIPSEKELDRIRREYPVGTIIELLSMSDKQAPPVGTLGEVVGCDSMGDLFMKWSNGSSLKVILSEDRVRKVAGAITICYGRRELWRSRKEAADFFLEGMASTEGSESERYATIYTKLILGYKVCSDED